MKIYTQEEYVRQMGDMWPKEMRVRAYDMYIFTLSEAGLVSDDVLTAEITPDTSPSQYVEKMASVEGYCYLRMFLAGSVNRARAILGPYPTLEKLLIQQVKFYNRGAIVNLWMSPSIDGKFHIGYQGQWRMVDVIKTVQSFIKQKALPVSAFGLDSVVLDVPLSAKAIVGAAVKIIRDKNCALPNFNIHVPVGYVPVDTPSAMVCDDKDGTVLGLMSYNSGPVDCVIEVNSKLSAVDVQASRAVCSRCRLFTDTQLHPLFCGAQRAVPGDFEHSVVFNVCKEFFVAVDTNDADVIDNYYKKVFVAVFLVYAACGNSVKITEEVASGLYTFDSLIECAYLSYSGYFETFYKEFCLQFLVDNKLEHSPQYCGLNTYIKYVTDNGKYSPAAIWQAVSDICLSATGAQVVYACDQLSHIFKIHIGIHMISMRI